MDNKKEITTYKPVNAICEIISTYIVDLFFNYLYLAAEKVKTDNLVNSYKSVIATFLKAAKDEDFKRSGNFYSQVIGQIKALIDIHIRETDVRTITNDIAKEFIPDIHFKTLSDEEKRNLTRKILQDIITKFGYLVFKNYINMIVDEHTVNSNVNIAKLKKTCNELQINIKDEYHLLFITKDNSSHEKKIIANLERKLSEANDDIVKIHKNIEIAKVELDKRKILIAEFSKREIEYKTTIEELKKEISSLRQPPQMKQFTAKMPESIVEEPVPLITDMGPAMDELSVFQ